MVGRQKFVQYIRKLWPGRFIFIAAVKFDYKYKSSFNQGFELSTRNFCFMFLQILVFVYFP